MIGIEAASNSPIMFPGLFGNWQFTMSPVALDIGNGVRWYGIMICLGLVLAVLFCLQQAPRYGLNEDNVLDTVIVGIPTAIIGARAYYVIFYLERFLNEDGSLNWGKAVAIWDGGIAIYGAIIGAFLGAFVLSRVKKFKFGALSDLGIMGLFIGQAVGRWGNFFNREAFGGLTDLPWRMGLVTTSGQYVEVHPTFLYESLWNAVGLLLVVFIVSKARHFDGENTWFYFLWYGLGRAWIEGLREDSLYLFDWQLFGEPIRVSQALSVVMILLSAAILFYHLKLRPHSREELWVEQVLSKKEAEEAAADEAALAEYMAQHPEEFPQQEAEAEEEVFSDGGDE